MDMDAISSACMMIYDELMDDEKSKDVIAKIDKGPGDEAIKEGIREAVARIEELGKITLANDIRTKTTGFAFPIKEA
jgi:hypothetical protein